MPLIGSCLFDVLEVDYSVVSKDWIMYVFICLSAKQRQVAGTV